VVVDKINSPGFKAAPGAPHVLIDPGARCEVPDSAAVNAGRLACCGRRVDQRQVGEEALQIPISGCERRTAAWYPSCAAQCWPAHPRLSSGPAVMSSSPNRQYGSPEDERLPFSSASQLAGLETTAQHSIRNEPTARGRIG
jgi:hypothetical protein